MTHDRSIDPNRLAVSFIVDRDPIYAYMGWHLVHSLVDHLRLPLSNMHVQFTADVPVRTIELFRRLGCSTHKLERFGDGRYCNKLAQWDNLQETAAEHLLFLDTDMICVSDFTDSLKADTIAAKVVDLPNPPLPLLELLFDRAGFGDRPETVEVDVGEGQTFKANCNGGVYSVPKRFASQLFQAWRRHALALLADIEPLKAANKESHVDQIAFCMAMYETKLPFAELPTNLNYPLHLSGSKRFVEARPLALLHYHPFSLDVLGLIVVKGELDEREQEALDRANRKIRENFEGETFWGFRYQCFPERGSGVGSRGANLEYKRQLLRSVGAEEATSVLDVGCGDLEVVRSLNLKDYVGVDVSPAALARAAQHRPDWTFREAPAPEVKNAELVICFEVAIHQSTAADYHALINYVTSRTDRTLIISGYDSNTGKIAANHMLRFYEPLRTSLENSRRFKTVQQIGAHSDVVIYRCETC